LEKQCVIKTAVSENPTATGSQNPTAQGRAVAGAENVMFSQPELSPFSLLLSFGAAKERRFKYKKIF